MRSVILVDTSIFLNVLDVPGFNQNSIQVRQELEELIENEDSLLLPIAAIVEAGNHIAQLSHGSNRRRFAEQFVEQVKMAFSGDAPWTPTRVPDLELLAEWLTEFPDRAMQGISLGDLTIIKEWEAACERHPRMRVRIWSLDQHLKGYDRSVRFRLRRR